MAPKQHSHRDFVLAIPELTDGVLSLVDDCADLAGYARVCRTWNAFAMKGLWESLPSFYPLFRLLGPLEEADDGDQIFTREIQASDWDKVEHVRHLVKALVLRTEGIHESVLHSTIVTSRQDHMVVLPRLQELEIIQVPESLFLSWLQFATILLHPGLRRFSLRALHMEEGDGFEDAVVTFLEAIVIQAPHLEDLSLSFNAPLPHLGDGFTNALQNMHSLRRLSATAGLLDGAALLALSTLPHLEEVTTTKLEKEIDVESMGFGYGFGIMSLPPAYHDVHQPFPSLRSLDFYGTYIVVRELFRARNLFSFLTKMHIDLTEIASPGAIRSMLEPLSVSSPCLRHLQLTVMQFHLVQDAEEEVPDGQCLRTSDLSPLTSLRDLHVFSLKHMYPVTITDRELVDFISCCPKLEELDLNSQPLTVTVARPSSLTLHVLALLAERANRIRRLRLYLDTRLNADQRKSAGARRMCQSLEFISFGTSPVSGVSDVARYLNKALPEALEVGVEENAHPSCYELILGAEWLDKMDVHRDSWREVSNARSSLRNADWEEESRDALLDEELSLNNNS